MDELRLVLLGGPYDGAEGPCGHAGKPEIFVRSEDPFDHGDGNGLNGLFAADQRYRPDQVRYILTSRCDRGRYVYSYGEGSGSFIEPLAEAVSA